MCIIVFDLLTNFKAEDGIFFSIFTYFLSSKTNFKRKEAEKSFKNFFFSVYFSRRAYSWHLSLVMRPVHSYSKNIYE